MTFDDDDDDERCAGDDLHCSRRLAATVYVKQNAGDYDGGDCDADNDDDDDDDDFRDNNDDDEGDDKGNNDYAPAINGGDDDGDDDYEVANVQHHKKTIREKMARSGGPIYNEAYDELSDQGYSSLPKRYQKSDGLQVQLCWVGAKRHES